MSYNVDSTIIIYNHTLYSTQSCYVIVITHSSSLVKLISICTVVTRFCCVSNIIFTFFLQCTNVVATIVPTLLDYLRRGLVSSPIIVY